MTRQENLWKCEYENLRRKKNKQINAMNLKMIKFMDITFNLLKEKGMSDSEIFTYYQERN